MYYEQHKDKINAKARETYAENRESVLAKQRAKYIPVEKKERPARKSGAQRTKEYRLRHPEKIKAAVAKYKAENPEKIRAWRRRHHHQGMTDPVFVIVKRLRTRLHDEVRFRARKTKKLTSALNLVGCTREELKTWIESQFKPGMGWHNRSEWHIDHKRPVASFDMMDLEEQKKCFHYTNLQPLWVSENTSKGSRFTAVAA